MAGISSFINRFNVVKQIPIFSKLSWFEHQKIARKAILEEFKKGEHIAEEGTPPDFFYCLISGRLQAYTMDEQGSKENVDFIHRGVHFGIISLLTGENHSLTYQALNDSVVLKINKEDFHVLLKNIPSLGIEFSQSLSKRIRKTVKGTKTIFESTIISVYSPVIGTGSSTYAVNLAFSLAKETKKKVVLVNVQTTLQQEIATQEDRYVTKDWKRPPINIEEIAGDHEKITASIVKNEDGIDLLNVIIDSDDQDIRRQISPFIGTLVGDYHYVVVDLPNNMDDVVQETLTQSDLVHLLTLDRRKDLEMIRQVIDKLEVKLKQNFREERIRVIIRAAHDKVYLSFEEINKFIDYSVYTMLPTFKREEIQESIFSGTLLLRQCDLHHPYSKSVRRIAREIGGVLVGVVLGGGAALGVAHIGAIRVFEQEDIPVDVVVGSSMGALIAAIWSIGKNSDELEVIAREFESGLSMLKLFDPPFFPISGLVRGRAIKRWLKKHLGNATFYGTKFPLKIVSYDLIRREEIVLNSGSLVDAVRQSVSIPGVIRPVMQGDQMIIDGGVLNPLPTNVLSSLGIKKIIAINVLQSPEDVSEGFDIAKHQLREIEEKPFIKDPFGWLSFRIGRALGKPFHPNISDIIVRTLQASEHVIAEQSAQLADVVIHPDLVGINWFELYRVDDLIKNGEAATRELLPEIKRLVEE